MRTRSRGEGDAGIWESRYSLESEHRAHVLASHARDVRDRDLFRADRLTFPFVRAAAKAFGVGLLDHLDHASIALDLTLRQQPEVRDLCAHEQMRRRVLARRDARAAADARRRIHRVLGDVFRHRDGVAIWRAAAVHGHVAAGGDDAIERAAVDDEILDDGECLRAPWFDCDSVAVLEAA